MLQVTGFRLDHSLPYTYSGNVLTKVTDFANNSDGFDQQSTASTHYNYDYNGNLAEDKNKNIESIKYFLGINKP